VIKKKHNAKYGTILNALGSSVAKWATIATMLALTAGTGRAAEYVDIGVAASLTGPLAGTDIHLVEGARLAAKQINLKGGVGGREIRLQIRDNASNAATGVTVTNQLLNEFNLTAMIGGASSAQTAAIQPILKRMNVPAFTVSILPTDSYSTFMATIEFTRYIDVQLQFVKSHLKGSRVALLHSNTPFGQIGAKLFQNMASDMGVVVVQVEGVDNSATDLTPQMAKIKELKPDAVVDLMTGPVHVVEAQAAATVGLTVPIVLSLDDLSTFRLASEAYPNVRYISVPVQTYPEIVDPKLKEACAMFLDAYKAAKLDPSGVMGASGGWDAVHMIALAVGNAGSTAPADARKAIQGLSYQGCTTAYKFTPDDHTGQKNRANPLSISRFDGSSTTVLFRP
jgi:branched-chain amino acid transport system substrate-binding protein